MDTEPLITTGPERIVVQAKARFVPGDEYNERCNLMKDLICQQILNRNFDIKYDRFRVHRALFAYPNKSCYFLLDYGHAMDDNVPTSLYKWDGNSMTRQQHLPSEMLKKLEEYPFSKKARPATVFCTEISDESLRYRIRQRFRMNMKVPDNEAKYLQENPDAVQWLLKNVDESLRSKIIPYADVKEEP